MKKSIIIVLQIITLLLMVSQHFLQAYFSKVLIINAVPVPLSTVTFWFGYRVTSVIVDVMLYVTIGLQLTVIVLLIENKK